MKFIVFFFTLQSHLGGSQETMRGKQLLLPTQSTNSLDPHILLLMCAITTKHYTFNQLLNDQHESFSLKETAWNALNITKPLKSSANFLNRLAWGETSFLVKFYQRLTKDQQWLKLTEWKSQLLWFQNTQLCFRRPLKHRIMLLVLPFNHHGVMKQETGVQFTTQQIQAILWLPTSRENQGSEVNCCTRTMSRKLKKCYLGQHNCHIIDISWLRLGAQSLHEIWKEERGEKSS